MTPEDEKRLAEIELENTRQSEQGWQEYILAADDAKWLIAQIRAESAHVDAAEQKLARITAEVSSCGEDAKAVLREHGVRVIFYHMLARIERALADDGVEK